MEQYLKALNYLTINEENRLKLKVDELEKKNTEIKGLKRRTLESEQSNQ